ncbi:ABC transporter ATP-binding protein [Actinomadura syzygii]|uniref:ABC transporter ATP-binding protein n=1 Tax=Actinomadura syzygii TaxID=1427538 RepID=A0A5D0TNX3_9ACTN|nr:ABC transporter ATP-binding protein [Actinomadura syzygii]
MKAPGAGPHARPGRPPSRERRTVTVAAVVRRDLSRGNPGLAALVVAAGGTAIGCRLAAPAALAAVVGALPGRAPVAAPLTVLAAVLLGGLAATAAADQAAAALSAAVTRRHRAALLRHALRMSPRDARFGDGELLTRFSTDAVAPGDLLASAISVALGGCAGAGALVALASVRWWLALLVVAELAAAFGVVRVFVRRASRAERRYQAARGDLAGRIVDAHRGARTIRACGTRDQERRRILVPLAELRSAGRASWAAQRQVTWRMGLIVPLQQVVLLTVLGFGLLTWRLDLGEVVAALAYARLALGLLDHTDELVDMARLGAGVRRLGEVLDRPAPGPAADPPRPPPPGGPGEIRFEDVLAGVTFTVPAGRHVAVVGRSGAGKSLLVAMVGRLAEPGPGRVLLDGVDVRDADPPALRREVVYAFAVPELFGPTVRAAITAGLPDGAPGRAEAAARLARADGFVRRLPTGYDTPPGRAPLSGGELQRLGLARALARPGRVLVLDDATSSLDTATEAEVVLAVRDAWRGRTALVVAHRPALAGAADLVAWLDGGRLRALRPHAEQWRDPEYRAIFQGDS